MLGIKQNINFQKVLIIDDELDTCFLLGRALKRYGIQSLIAHSLEEGFVTLTSEKPQLVFLDNNLPDGLGIDQIQKIRVAFPNIKLVMITAMSTLKEKALLMGANFFIEKPLDLSKIELVLAYK
jgi:DNA-binding response OmpR family regulator